LPIDYPIISQYVSDGKTIIHVYSEAKPDEGFQQTDATLEDVYFSTINQKK